MVPLAFLLLTAVAEGHGNPQSVSSTAWLNSQCPLPVIVEREDVLSDACMLPRRRALLQDLRDPLETANSAVSCPKALNKPQVGRRARLQNLYKRQLGFKSLFC